jgi:hypothetical protein
MKNGAFGYMYINLISAGPIYSPDVSGCSIDILTKQSIKSEADEFNIGAVPVFCVTIPYLIPSNVDEFIVAYPPFRTIAPVDVLFALPFKVIIQFSKLILAFVPSTIKYCWGIVPVKFCIIVLNISNCAGVPLVFVTLNPVVHVVPAPTQQLYIVICVKFDVAFIDTIVSQSPKRQDVSKNGKLRPDPS